MLELGAYWAYYSLWFAKTVKDAQCFLVEPMSEKTSAPARGTSRSTGPTGHFTQAFVGSSERTDREGKRFVAVDPFCERNGIEHLAILHADIQGGEVGHARRRERLCSVRKAADWVFISTHSNKLHYECVEILKSYGYLIMASADLDETYSTDGLIVAKADASARTGDD